MRKKIITTSVSILLCFLLAFNSIAIAAKSQPDSIIDDVSIVEKHGIIEGEVIQLQAQITPQDTYLSRVKWSSSDPSVISCTKDGVIKGLTPGKYADITCKAKLGSASDTIRIYCVEKINNTFNSNMKNFFTFIYSQPKAADPVALHINLTNFFGVFGIALRVLARMGSSASLPNAISSVTGWTVEVCGKSGNFAYIRFDGKGATDGFVKYTKLEKPSSSFLYLSATDMDVWADGTAYDNRKLTTNYTGSVEWIVENDDYIDFDDKTGQIIGKVPGKTTTITAKAGGSTQKCTVHLLYKWPQSWTAKTNKEQTIYKAKGNTYEKYLTIGSGKEIVVLGDSGTDDGWAYVRVEINGNKKWGYVPISDISTKGTVSQYNNLKTTLENGDKVSWIWPVRDVKNGVAQTTKARYITSPYGWRDTDPARHKGVDITNGVSSNSDFANSVDGYEVVSAFAGTVIYVYDISSGYKSCGNCVAIRSNEKDPITGKYYVAIYMHLKSKPNVKRNQEISANTLLGYVGDTGNSGGSHLHFEVNNQNLSYGQKIYYENNSDKEMVFGSVINPLFFYIDYYNLPKDNPYKIIVNSGCDAMKYRKPLWYGDDIKESKEP